MKDTLFIKDKRKSYFLYKVYKKYKFNEMYALRIKANKFGKFPRRSIIIYGTWLFKIKNAKKVILFESAYTKRISKLIKKTNPNCKIYMYFWNIIKDRARTGYLEDKNIDEFYTFDIADSKKYNINYNPQFYSDKIKLKNNDIIYDILFVGRDKGRKEKLKELENKLNSMGIVTKFIIIEKEKDFLSYKKCLDLLSKSKAVLDFVQDGQVGLTLRTMESIFLNKKLVTNNKDTINYDFYNKNNIFILGKDNIKNMNKFLNLKNEEISKEILEFYNIGSWIKRFK